MTTTAKRPIFLVLWICLFLVVSGCTPQEKQKDQPEQPTADQQVTLTPRPAATTAPAFTPAPTRIPPTSTRQATSTPRPTRITPTPIPTASATLTPAPQLTTVEGVMPMTLTVVYDNYAFKPDLKTAWGFSCLIETVETTILFDTGADGPTLLSNMEALGLDLTAVDVIALSHIHSDHVGGLVSVLETGITPLVYAPASFPQSFKDRIRSYTELVEVNQPVKICPGVYSTGEMGTGIVEQALAIETSQGLVVVTGCAHPGITAMVSRAMDLTGSQVFLVLGGFHLRGKTPAQVGAIIDSFRTKNVQKVSPSHCTGDAAIALFREAYGEDFVPGGVGQVFQVEP